MLGFLVDGHIIIVKTVFFFFFFFFFFFLHYHINLTFEPIIITVGISSSAINPTQDILARMRVGDYLTWAFTCKIR